MNQNHYKTLIEQSTFGFARLKVILNSSDSTYDFEIEEVNPAFETITGVSEKLATGAGLNVFFDDNPDEAAQKQAIFRQLLLENKSVETELFAHKLDRWLRISASPAGQSHIDLLFSDITPRKQAEDKFANAFRLAPHSMTINCIKTGMFVDVNDAFLKVTGYSYEDIIGKSATELGLWANPSDRDKVIADLKKGQEVRVREYMFKNCKGEQLHGLYSASVIHINNKPHILTSIEDITERKNAQLALEAEHKKMNALVAAMPDMIFIQRKDGTTLEMYGAKPELLIAPPEKIIGCSIRDIFSKEEYERHISTYETCLREGTTASIEFELDINDEKMFFESRISPLDENRLLTVVQNITETKNMQETIKEELAYRNFLFESDREGLLIMNNDHQVIDANNKICEMLGYSYEEVLQLFTWDLDALNSREKILSNFDNSRDVDTRFESLHQRKDGSTYNVEVSARSFWWKNERLVFCACRDISDRKKLERQTIEAKNLAETNHKRFEEIAAHTGEFIWEGDADGLYTYANSACQSILGYSPEEIVGKMTFADLLHEKERDIVVKTFEELAAQKSPIVNLENTMIGKDGRTVYAVTNGIPMIGEDGQLIGYRGSDRDITKQYEAEAKLKDSENKFRMLVENVSDVLFTLKPDGTISYMSPAVKNLSGFEADDYVGKHFSMFIYKDDLEGVAYDFEQLRTGNYYPSEYRINTKHGNEVWVRSSTKAVNENTYSGIARDITSEKEAVKALKDSEAQYRMLFNANLDSLSIVYIEPDGGVSNFVEINDAGANIIGFSREELLRKSPSDIEVGTSTEEVGERIKQLQESGMAVFETIMRNKKGENRSLEVKAILINYRNRPAILNISRDITERKKTEEALIQSNNVVENVQIGLYIYHLEEISNDRTLRLKYANPATEQMTGIKAADVVGNTLDENFPLLRDLKLPQRYAEVVRSRKAQTFEDILYSDDRIMQACFSVKAFPLPNNHLGVAFEDITRKVADQQAIETSNARLKEAQQVGNVGSWDYDLINEKLTWSEQTYHIYGQSPERFIATFESVVAHYPEEDRQAVHEAFNKSLEERSELRIDHRIITESGEIRYVQEIGKLVMSETGEPLRMIGSVMDITERKKAEIALKESEIFAFTVANSTPALLYIYNIEKQQNIWSNEAHKKYFSNIFDDTSGLYSSDIEKIIHPDDFRHTQTLLHNMLADNNKQQMNAEVRIGEKGNWSWMNLMLSKFKTDENGNTIEILGALFDIDERKKAEEELMLKNSNTAFLNEMAIKLANIQLSTDIGKAIIPDIKKHTGAIYAMHTHFDHEKHAFLIKHIEADSKIINAVMKIAGEEIFNKPSKLSIENYRKVSVSNVDVYRSINELTFGDVPEIVSKAIGAITGVTQIYGLIHVVGDKIYGGTVLGFGKNQPLPSEDMLRSYAYLMAITLRRNFAEQELIKAKEAAEESNRLKSAFLASISHELRTPLNHVIGFSDLIKSEVTDPEIHKYASIIFDSGTNFLTMIEDILALALSEQTEIKLRMQSFKGMDLFLENRNLLHEILHNSGKTEDIKLYFKPEASVLASLFTSDRLKINQVLTNLFKNAVKYTHKGSITFGMRQEDEETLMLYVTDTGIGIAKDKLDIIFDFFRQGDDTHTRLYGGLGLGLAISQRIANIMGASLSVKSNLGEGSTFYFSIPVGFIGDMGTYEKDHNQTKLPDLRNHTLLIAEDDEDSMMMITTLLKSTKAKLLCASNGQEAVSIFEQNMDIELVLMDIKMPVMDGLQATRIIKSRKPALPVIALTAYALAKEKAGIKDAGCDSIVTKPINKTVLFNAINKYIG